MQDNLKSLRINYQLEIALPELSFSHIRIQNKLAFPLLGIFKQNNYS